MSWRGNDWLSQGVRGLKDHELRVANVMAEEARFDGAKLVVKMPMEIIAERSEKTVGHTRRIVRRLERLGVLVPDGPQVHGRGRNNSWVMPIDARLRVGADTRAKLAPDYNRKPDHFRNLKPIIGDRFSGAEKPIIFAPKTDHQMIGFPGPHQFYIPVRNTHTPRAVAADAPSALGVGGLKEPEPDRSNPDQPAPPTPEITKPPAPAVAVAKTAGRDRDAGRRSAARRVRSPSVPAPVKTAWPEGLALTAAARQVALAAGILDADLCWGRFKADALAHGRVAIDWLAKFDAFCRSPYQADLRAPPAAADSSGRSPDAVAAQAKAEREALQKQYPPTPVNREQRSKS